ncbi:LysR family transcriptional regulator [Leeia sp. TBRC 13508]|uniref:LysR family transcriptional regulator n=1 Tax=Leeia speluncae TaxID=2884804 RepID=A0ABS8D8V0_9NEIS|nr:hydrogen peroxide-inducible genes activator [Leeia speluncae]MCB6184611.1 LysR family transcriptional regulator [Leeia speluncae]
MTLTELRYILAVATTRHFGRAADACYVSQPTLSVAVKKLEEELGVQIFERNGEITLTPLGEQIIQQAQRVLEEADSLKQIAKAGQDQLSVPLRLGVIYTVAPGLLPHLIQKLKPMAPQMPLLIEENYTSKLCELLRQGKLDAMILALPFNDTGFEMVSMYDESFVVATPVNHKWAEESDRLPPAKLVEDDVLLLGQGNCFRDQVLQVCPALNRGGQAGLQRTLEGSSLATIRQMVASGLGVTVLPANEVAENEASYNLMNIIRFESPEPTRRIVLAWRRRFPRPDAIEVLQKAIRQCPLHGVTWIEPEPTLS